MFAPGLLLAGALGIDDERLLPSFIAGCGALYVIGNYGGVVHVPFFPVAPLLIVVAAEVTILRRGILHDVRIPRRETIARWTILLLGGSVLVLLWRRGSGSFGQLLPNHDAMYHSYVIRNIIETNSIRVRSALRLFPTGAGSAADFYPVGLHAAIAGATRLSGSSINSAMNATAIIVALGLFPTSMHAWTRRLIGDRRHLPLYVVIGTLLLSPIFPFSPFSWGGLPTIVGMAMAPAAAVLVDRHLESGTRTGRMYVVAVLVGMFSVHSPELVLVLLLVVPLRAASGKGRKAVSGMLKELCVIGIWSGLALLPVVLSTAGGAAERNLDYQTKLDLVTNTGQTVLLGLTGIALPLTAFIVALGSYVAVRRNMSRVAIGLSVVIVTVILAGEFPGNSLVRTLTKPWYGQVLRLNYNIVYFAVPAVVVALGWALESRRATVRVLVAMLVVPILFASSRTSVDADGKLLGSWYPALVPTDGDSIRAYEWMAERLGKDQFVMTDYDGIDGSTWMYAISGAKPVMYGAIARDDRDRWRSTKTAILANIGHLSDHPELLEFVASRGIKYFYFDERTNAVSPNHSFTLDRLRSDRALTEVHVEDNAHVFEFNRR